MSPFRSFIFGVRCKNRLAKKKERNHFFSEKKVPHAALTHLHFKALKLRRIDIRKKNGQRMLHKIHSRGFLFHAKQIFMLNLLQLHHTKEFCS